MSDKSVIKAFYEYISSDTVYRKTECPIYLELKRKNKALGGFTSNSNQNDEVSSGSFVLRIIKFNLLLKCCDLLQNIAIHQ